MHEFDEYITEDVLSMYVALLIYRGPRVLLDNDIQEEAWSGIEDIYLSILVHLVLLLSSSLIFFGNIFINFRLVFLYQAKALWNLESKFAKKVKIYVGVVLIQFGFAGFAIVAKFALNKGTSHYTFSVYRSAIAAVVLTPFALVLERNNRPKMTLPIIIKIMFLGLLDPVIGQNMFYAGMNLTTATFATAMCNILPALTFLIAWILRVEKVNVRKLRSQAKILGTLVTVGGAMIMTLVRGPDIGLPWTKDQHKIINAHSSNSGGDLQHPIKGGIVLAIGSLGYSLFYILQANTLKAYPTGLSLTALICASGALQGTAVTFAVERGNTAIWSIGWNAQLLAYAYGGVISSGITYYLSGVIMKEKGPVFVTSFNPLNMVIVAVLSTFIFAEQLDVGKVTGATVIVTGLYLIVWGKNKEQMESSISASKSVLQKETTNPSSEGVKTYDVNASKAISANNNMV